MLIPHQANKRIIDAAMKYLDIPPERCVVNIQEYGNTSAASIPIALSEAVARRQSQAQRHHRLRRFRRRPLVGRRRVEMGSMSAHRRRFSRVKGRRRLAWVSMSPRIRPRLRICSTRANAVLGYDLLALQKDGPEEKLRETQYSQPAIFTTNVALFAALELPADAVVVSAGHSFGEYCSLYIARRDRIRRCAARRQRARHRDAIRCRTCARRHVGGAWAWTRTRFGASSSRRARQTGLRVQLANFNSPAQIVISGDLEGVRQARRSDAGSRCQARRSAQCLGRVAFGADGAGACAVRAGGRSGDVHAAAVRRDLERRCAALSRRVATIKATSDRAR